jgi:hypothetical protein
LEWLLGGAEAGILPNHHIAEDGPIVFAPACLACAEGIVSKTVDGAYQSGPRRVWITVGDPASIAVRQERSEILNSTVSQCAATTTQRKGR